MALRRRFEGFLDTEDVSKILGCHKETVRVMVRAGRLKPIYKTPPYAFDKQEIMALPRVRIGRPRKGDRS